MPGFLQVKSEYKATCEERVSRRGKPSLKHLCTALAISASVIACAHVTSTQPVHAQETLLDNQFQQNPNAPMLIQADELVFDNNNNTVRAQGNVEIHYNKYTLTAQKVIYNKSSNLLIAEGNVRIKEPDGALVNADRIELTDDFKKGFIDSLRIVTADNSHITAAQANRVDGNITVFEKGSFTPCKICEKDPSKPPTWQINAMKVIHNKVEKTVSYENATLEFLGVPIAYVPFFSHPDPTVKNKTGFLAPSFGHSGDLGFIIETPYHIALSESYDLTFIPVVMTKKGVMAKAKWRHRLKNGNYNIDMAGIYQQDKIDDGDPNNTSPEEMDFRGTIASRGKFSLGSFWDFGWDITVETDDEFRRFYKIDSIKQTDRVSQIYMVGQSERNYLAASLYHFGGLVLDDDSTAKSYAKPIIDYNYIFKDPILGGELSYDASVLNLTRNVDSDTGEYGADVKRGIINLKWRRQIIDGLGQVFTPFAQARGDIYQATNVTDLSDPAALDGDRRTAPRIIDEMSYTRTQVTAGLEYRYPFVAHSARASHIVEPIGQIIYREGTKETNDRPNEDAQSLVFDDTLLFDIDKFSGYDRMETGTRANIGLQYTLQLNSGGYLRALLGQSYHIAGENAFALSPVTNPRNNIYNTPDNGLEKDKSDYVAGLYVQPNANFTLIAQTRFDEDDYTVRRSDVYTSLKYGPIALTANYTRENPEYSDKIKEEVLVKSSLEVIKNWSVLSGFRYNLNEDFNVARNLGLKYADDCFMMAVNYSETFTSDDDIDPDKAIMFSIKLKHLGSYKVGNINVSNPLNLEDTASNN